MTSLRSLAAMGFAVSVVAVFSEACVIEAPLEGKSCPCVEEEGWFCDEALDVCERDTCDATFAVESFAPDWSTPHSILFRWQPAGLPERFLRYELLIAESKEDMRNKAGTYRVVGQRDNPELAYYELPSEGNHLVDYAVVRDLDPKKTYVARLLAYDVNDCPSKSEVVVKPTADEALAIISIFGPGVALPMETEERPIPGATLVGEGTNRHLVYEAEEDTACYEPSGSNDPICGQPVGAQRIEKDVSAPGPSVIGLTQGNFGNAYLEIAAEVVSAPKPVFGAWVWLLLSYVEQGTQNYKSLEMALPNESGPFVLEVPLDQLANSVDTEAGTVVTPLTFDLLDVQNGGRAVSGFAVGGEKTETTVIRIDSARILY